MSTGEASSDLIGAAEAAAVLEVEDDRLRVMVSEGLLTPVGGKDPTVFARAEVEALRQSGA